MSRPHPRRPLTQGLDLAHNPDYTQQIPGGWSAAAENVGWIDDGGQLTPQEVAARIHQGWMESRGHRENLLNRRTPTWGLASPTTRSTGGT